MCVKLGYSNRKFNEWHCGEEGKISTFETVIHSLIKFNQVFRRSIAFVGNNKAAAKTDLAD